MTPESAPLRLPPPDDPYDEVIDVWRLLADLGAEWRILITGTVVGAVAGAIVSVASPVSYEGTSRLRIGHRADVNITPTTQTSYRALASDPVVVEQVVAELGWDAPPPIAVLNRIGDASNIIEISVRLPDAQLAQRAANAAARRTVELAASEALALDALVNAQVKRSTADADQLVAERRQELADLLGKPRPKEMSDEGYEKQRKLLQARAESAEMLQHRINDIAEKAVRDRPQPFILEYVDEPSAVSHRASPTAPGLAWRGGVAGLVVAVGLLIGYRLFRSPRLRTDS